MFDPNNYKEKLLEKLNPNFKSEILRIESQNPIRKIAAFDMDGTLLNGDLGEAVFCYLKANGYNIDFKWREYHNLLEQDLALVAYTEIVKSLKGINARSVMNATKNLLISNSSEIHFIEDEIDYFYPIPKPIQDMVNLIYYLKINNWQVTVISATCHTIVRTFSDIILKINPEYVCGIRSEFYVTDNYEDIFTDEIKGEVTYKQGKLIVYNRMFGETKPLITSGDSLGDIELLNYTHPEGSRIICGNSNENIQKIKQLLNSQINTTDVLIT